MNEMPRDLQASTPDLEPTGSPLQSKAVQYVVVDVETTGLSPTDSHIVEIAMVTLDEGGTTISEWSSLIRPPGDDELGATHIHGITRQMVESAPDFAALADEILDRIQDRVIVGHVIEFDLGHLIAEFARIKRPLPNLATVSICTRNLARTTLRIRPVTLENCCYQLGITIHGAHSALGDTRATAELFRELLASVDATTLERLQENTRLLGWSRPLFSLARPVAMPREIV